MRLLFVSAYYPPHSVGGGEESTFALARALVHRGHDVLVLAPRLGAGVPPAEVPVQLVDLGLGLAEPGKPLRPRAFDRPDRQLRFARAVAEAAADRDLVHCQSLPLLPAAYRGARRAGKPILATLRDLGGVCSVNVCLLRQSRVPHDCGVVRLERTCAPEFRRIYGGSPLRTGVSALAGFATARARSAILRRCDGLFSVGSDLGELYAAAGLVDRSRVALLPNIAEIASVERTDDAGAYAIYAGKVSPGKGLDELLEACRLVRRQAPEFGLVVAGYADASWEARLARAEGVEHVGRVPRDRLAELYAAARFAVVPSIWPEPFPRAVLEAAYSGLPVVASSAGGTPDAVRDGETGLLVPPRDPQALAAAMLELWIDPARAARLGRAARSFVDERFAAAVVVRRAERLYADAVAVSAGDATARSAVALPGRTVASRWRRRASRA